jgi:hypothetical protein
MKFDAGTAA